MKHCTSMILGTLPLLAVASLGFGQARSGAEISHNPLRGTAVVGGGVAGTGCAINSGCGDVTITESLDPVTIVAGNSVSCNAGGLHTDNSYYREFALTGPFTPCEVDLGIESATSGTGTGQPLTIRLYDTTVAPSAGLPAAVFEMEYTVADAALEHAFFDGSAHFDLGHDSLRSQSASITPSST